MALKKLKIVGQGLLEGHTFLFLVPDEFKINADPVRMNTGFLFSASLGKKKVGIGTVLGAPPQVPTFQGRKLLPVVSLSPEGSPKGQPLLFEGAQMKSGVWIPLMRPSVIFTLICSGQDIQKVEAVLR